ncbi:MAG TPA: nucleoside recognition domain-containing protein [Muribaculum sp.]|uniref:Nucleoside recognition domain-containing protein n=1 Tax=Heminiphilus faecis TaxID=2601703 RepID=A0ABV4CUU9_9BACT|nr:spore maturation protein [Heminiphilus faecis]RLT75750.1 hypothetical protein D7V95_12165 [bacterium J10(2018)]HRF69290.1 nucleoside recognition domain-containing protein [Muribaculum sp.]
MALNYIWIAFFLVAFLVALGKTLFFGDFSIWSSIMSASFSSAATAFEISLGLTGILSLWMGLMKIGERGGVIQFFGRMISPLFCRLFPGIPKGHPAMGSIFMNVSANMLGLDNAATPLGLKAMQEMQSLNEKKDTATDAMLMFLVLNASGLCFIPIGIMMYRAQAGAANPTDVFLPILLATFIATFVGIVAMCIKQRIKLWDRVMTAWLGGLALLVGGIVWFFSSLPKEEVELYSSFVANVLLFSVIIMFICAGLKKRINMYDAFIEGAKEGFKTAVMIIPYLVAILVAIGMFRASGAMDVVTDAIASCFSFVGLDAEWVGALPTALMKPLSGSGSRGMMVDLMNTYGPDAFVSRVSAAIQGSTDTTFYILAVYFGSVGVVKTRYAVPYALLADAVGSLAGVIAAYLFFS